MKIWILIAVLFGSLHSIGQTADSLKLDEIISVNPNTLPEEVFDFDKLTLPRRIDGFAGVRFVDVRPYKDCIGFVKLKGVNKKIVPEGGLEHAVNNKLKPAKGSGDSLVIFIKYFWETRIDPLQLQAEEEDRDGFKKPDKDKAYAFCHITAASFVKNKEGFLYCGKVDTVITHYRKLLSGYATFSGKAIDFLLDNMPLIPSGNSKVFTASQVYASLSKPVVFPASDEMPNGIFLTYADFKQNKIQRKAFNVGARYYGYVVTFENNADAIELGDNFWGFCYNKQLYVKYTKGFGKLNKSGDTYTTYCGSTPSWERGSPSNLLVRSLLPKDVLAIGDATEINKYTKKLSDFFPLLLNPLTGHLE